MRLWRVLVLFSLVLAACTAAGIPDRAVETTSTVPSTTEAPTATTAEPLPDGLQRVLGTWVATTTLIFAEGGTYELVSALGSDLGTYELQRDGRTVQMTTTSGDVCEVGQAVARNISVSDLPGDRGFRLRLEVGEDACSTRMMMMRQMDRIGGGISLVGEWTALSELTLEEDMRYEFATPLGVDVGTYTYDVVFGSVSLVTDGGDLCQFGARDRLTLVTDGIRASGFLLVSGDEPGAVCENRAGLSQWMEPRDV